jgi:hypothetical protein
VAAKIADFGIGATGKRRCIQDGKQRVGFIELRAHQRIHADYILSELALSLLQHKGAAYEVTAKHTGCSGQQGGNYRDHYPLLEGGHRYHFLPQPVAKKEGRKHTPLATAVF